jgi:hypothetical protein
MLNSVYPNNTLNLEQREKGMKRANFTDRNINLSQNSGIEKTEQRGSDEGNVPRPGRESLEKIERTDCLTAEEDERESITHKTENSLHRDETKNSEQEKQHPNCKNTTTRAPT